MARTAKTPEQRVARRSPAGEERQRDPAASRRKILDAALAEFAEKGFAGTRVRDIAERAGLSSQLITYYFGGKEGLYRELMAGWQQQEAVLGHLDGPLGETLAAGLRFFASRPDLLRMFLWETLTRSAPADEESAAAAASAELTELRRRQAAGEIAADLDPAYVMVFFMGALMTPVTIPDQIKLLCGVEAGSDEFVTEATHQLGRILDRLAEPARGMGEGHGV